MNTFFHFPKSLLLFATFLGTTLLTAFAAEIVEIPSEYPTVRRDATVRAVEKVMPSVVNIGTETIVQTRDTFEQRLREYFDPYYRQRKPDSQYSLGSGVIIDEEGYVITNDHVVRRASRIWVKLMDGREYEADVVASTSRSDIALLKIKNEDNVVFKAAEFADDDDLLLGETVIALGNPFGLGGSVSKGILSSKNRRPTEQDETLDIADWLQTDAAINPGNSGGPLINLEGKVIGIDVAVYSAGQGIGFAVPIKQVSQSISHIFTPESQMGLWFGARITAGQPPLKVLETEKDSPARQAGLKAGDVILEVNGETPTSFIDFNKRLQSPNGPSPTKLKVRRGSKDIDIGLNLIPEEAYFNEDLIRKRTGLGLQPLTQKLARDLGLNRYGGFLISDVERNSPAEKIKLESGIVIEAFDEMPASSMVQAARYLQSLDIGSSVNLGIRVYAKQGRRRVMQTYVAKLKTR
ncbi:trypsin-like peptidase domain-containing protein [Verrucomicrobia bacterium]|nr:trypsin-like peptidase domain-containing protein [Verrucomicrobiota bacterium]